MLSCQTSNMSILNWFAKKKELRTIEESKLDIPGNLWIKCISCHEILYSKDLNNNLKVCPLCQHHFRLNHKERIDITLDPESFNEINENISPVNFLKFEDSLCYDERIKKAKKRSGIKDAVVTGIGKINEQEVAIAIMDFTYMGGSMGSVVGEKITLLIEEAIKKNLPIIIMSSSGGARMQEGAISLMQMAKTSAALKKAKNKGLLFVSVLLDPTTGGTTASFAMLGDINLTEPNALIGFAGSRVIEQTIKQKLPKNFQRSEYLLEHGMIDHICKRKDLKKCLSRIIRFTQEEKKRANTKKTEANNEK